MEAIIHRMASFKKQLDHKKSLMQIPHCRTHLRKQTYLQTIYGRISTHTTITLNEIPIFSFNTTAAIASSRISDSAGTSQSFLNLITVVLQLVYIVTKCGKNDNAERGQIWWNRIFAFIPEWRPGNPEKPLYGFPGSPGLHCILFDVECYSNSNIMQWKILSGKPHTFSPREFTL